MSTEMIILYDVHNDRCTFPKSICLWPLEYLRPSRILLPVFVNILNFVPASPTNTLHVLNRFYQWFSYWKVYAHPSYISIPFPPSPPLYYSKSISIYNYNMDILAEHRLSQQTLDVQCSPKIMDVRVCCSFIFFLFGSPSDNTCQFILQEKKKTDRGGAFISASLN